MSRRPRKTSAQNSRRCPAALQAAGAGTAPQIVDSSPMLVSQRNQIASAFGPGTPLQMKVPGEQLPAQKRAEPGVAQLTFDKAYKQVNDLATLNLRLAALTPGVAALTLGAMNVPGATATMFDAVIAADTNALYDSMSQQDAIDFYTDALTDLVDTQAPNFTYDSHGDKHFAGGSGTKFTAGKGTVNPILEGLLAAEIGRLRRHAAGTKTTYYYTGASIDQCPADHDLTIQLTYDPASDTIDYHGYPDDSVTVYSLSTSKGGAAIP